MSKALRSIFPQYSTIWIIAGHFLEHYENNLFTLLVPLISQQMFGDDPYALVKALAMIPISRAIKPVGALFWGWLADTYSPSHALSSSILGMALVSLLLALGAPVTSYLSSPCTLISLMIICKTLQIFFSCSQTPIAELLSCSLDNTKNVGTILQSTTILAFFSASLSITLLIAFGLTHCWPVLYLLGSLCSFIVFVMRKKLPAKLFSSPSLKKAYKENSTNFSKNEKVPFLKKIQKYLQLSSIQFFSHFTYFFCFTYLTSSIIDAKAESKFYAMFSHTTMLLLDLLFLLFATKLSKLFTLKGLVRLSLSLWIFTCTIALFIIGIRGEALSFSCFFSLRVILILAACIYASITPVLKYQVLSNQKDASSLCITHALASFIASSTPALLVYHQKFTYPLFPWLFAICLAVINLRTSAIKSGENKGCYTYNG